MTNEEIKESLSLFTELEHWQGFLELAAEKDRMLAEFFAPATSTIRQHFKGNLPPGWVCEAHNDTRMDLRWYQSEFGPNSLGLWFGWKYQFVLRLQDQSSFDALGMIKALDSPDFFPLQEAMMRCDPRPDNCCILYENRNFSFENSSFNGHFPEAELAWYAYNHKDEFVNQAINKVQRFLGDNTILALLEKLNRNFRKTHL